MLLLLALHGRVGSALQLPPLAFHLSPQHAAASVCIFAAGDIVSQQIERRNAAPQCATPPLSRGVQRTASAAAHYGQSAPSWQCPTLTLRPWECKPIHLAPSHRLGRSR